MAQSDKTRSSRFVSHISKSVLWVIPLLFLIAALTLKIMSPTILGNFQLAVFDNFQRIQPREYQATPVRIIDIDDESIEKLGQWPWPRNVVAELVNRLTQMGVAAIAFDMVFAEPDRTSPKQILKMWSLEGADSSYAQMIRGLPDHDDLFASAINQSNVVTGFALNHGDLVRDPHIKSGKAHGGLDPRYFVPQFSGGVTALENLMAAAAGNGSFNMVQDADGLVRRVPLFVSLKRDLDKEGIEEAVLFPGLANEALRIAQGASTYLIKSSGASGEESFGAETGIIEVKNGHFVIPTDPTGQVWIHYTEDVPERYIPAADIFDPNFDSTILQNNIVFVGTSAAGLFDLRSTPLNPALPGVEVHVQMVEQILTQHFLQRPDWAEGVELVFMFLIGVILILLIPRIGAGWAAVLGGVFLASAFGLSWYFFIEEKLLTDPVYPSIGILLVFLSSSITTFLRTDAERRNVRNAFGHYLSPALVEQLAEDPDQLVLGGERREMTILFSDIRGFTTISEQFPDPQDLTKFINSFLTPMTDVILDHKGTIDKYMGDAIMAFWNAPLINEHHAADAADAALTMFEALDTLNADLEQKAKESGRKHIPVKIGAGLNSGNICVGNMGSDQRFDYSVLGDEVNLASRLEGQSKTYAVDIVVGENTKKLIPDHAIVELDLIQVKGKTTAVRIFALLGRNNLKTSENFVAIEALHNVMLKSYRAQKWDEVTDYLAQLDQAAEKGLNPLVSRQLMGFYNLLRSRMAEYQAHPLPMDWDGVYVATSK